MAVTAVVVCGAAFGQSVAGDLLAGKLVDPKVGQWAWYDVMNQANKATYAIRMAIVDEEKVAGKQGYWLEIEVVPAAGYKTISKMLLTGPASDPRNVHKVILKDGPEPAQMVDVPRDAKDESGAASKRKSEGMENVVTKSGPVRAEHVSVRKGERAIEMWMSEDIKPCGIVRVTSPDGELILRNHGLGGPDAKTVITEVPEDAGKTSATPGKPSKEQPKFRVETKTGTGDQR
jgi:hypothetical protein